MTGQSSPATVTGTLCSQCVFKLAVSIENPAKCEVREVIQFLHAKGETAAEIRRQIFSVYGEGKTWQNGVVNLKREEVMFMIK
jgi:hypothetical protein